MSLVLHERSIVYHEREYHSEGDSLELYHEIPRGTMFLVVSHGIPLKNCHLATACTLCYTMCDHVSGAILSGLPNRMNVDTFILFGNQLSIAILVYDI